MQTKKGGELGSSITLNLNKLSVASNKLQKLEQEERDSDSEGECRRTREYSCSAIVCSWYQGQGPRGRLYAAGIKEGEADSMQLVSRKGRLARPCP